MDAIGRRGVAEEFDVFAFAIVAGVPEPVGVALAENPTALTDFFVPMARAGGGEHRVAGKRRPVHEFRRKQACLRGSLNLGNRLRGH